jgi:hypothetical protein
MGLKSTMWGAAVLLAAAVVPCVWAVSSVGFREYAAVVDDVSRSTRTFGQLIVHQGYEIPLGDTTRNIPILSIQQAGRHYREGPANDPNHVQTRAKSVAERLAHAWTLMDQGARLEIGDDDWNAYQVHAPAAAPKHTALFVRSPVAGGEPLRILTLYPEDVAGYPWVGSERSLAEYLSSLLQAHYLLFWKYEIDISKYNALRIGRTAEGGIFREIAIRAALAAKRKGQVRFDRGVLREVLDRLTLSERETLCRLATVPPMDWESSSRQ